MFHTVGAGHDGKMTRVGSGFFFFTTFRVFFIISIQMAFDGTFTAVVSPRSVRAPRLDAVHWSRGSDLDHVLLPLFTPR